MELTERQEKILHGLIKEYIGLAEPVSSDLLKKKFSLDVSPATIRNDLQELTEKGYISQPHTSAGRVPTEKAYRYFVDIIITQDQTPDYIWSQIEIAKRRIEEELKLAQELAKSLEQISTTLSYTRIESKDSIFETLKIIGPSKTSYGKNISLINKLLEELENF